MKQCVQARLQSDPETWNQTVSKPDMGTEGKAAEAAVKAAEAPVKAADARAGSESGQAVKDHLDVADAIAKEEGVGSPVRLGPDEEKARFPGFQILPARRGYGK